MRFQYDTLDDISFPNDGAFVRAQSFVARRSLGWDEDFATLNAGGTLFKTFGKNTFSAALEYSTTFGGRDEVENLYELGGFMRLSGFERGELTGPHAGYLRLMWYRRLADPAFFAWRFPLYFGMTFEAGNTWQERNEIDDLLLSTASFLGMKTPLGPLYVGYAYGEGSRHRGYLFLGFPFSSAP